MNLAQVDKRVLLSPYFINLVAELTEQVHAELVRLATKPESARGQVQTECNALRDLFARTTHDRRLNHKEAERHLSQHFGGNRVDYGDFAFRMEGYAAVLSSDGQGGALLREVAKLDMCESDTIETLEKRHWDVLAAERRHGSRSSCVHPWRSGNPSEEDPLRRPRERTPRLACGHTVV